MILDEFIAEGLYGIFINPVFLGLASVLAIILFSLSIGLSAEAMAVCVVAGLLIVTAAIPTMHALYVVVLLISASLIGLAFIRFLSR